MNSQPENAKPINTNAKDGDAAAAGGVAIVNLGGDMRGFAPTPLTSMIIDPAGSYLQVVCGEASGGTFNGVNYVISTDGGGSWSAPVKITATGSWLRNYNCIAADPTAWYPSVVVNQRTGTPMFGTWYTTDLLGPGGGSWASPALISDTVGAYAYMPTVAVNADGSKIAYLAYDAAWGYGYNYSTDYGSSWGTYNCTDADLMYETDWVDVSALAWGVGDDVHGFLGAVFNEDSLRSDIAGSGPFYCVTIGYTVSHDAGADYDTIRPLFNGHSLPQRASMNGDIVTYFIDTLDNGAADYEPVNAFLDTATGGWTNDLGESLGDGFGTWWYWWNANFFDGVAYIAMPIEELFIDYFDSGTKLHTWPWQGQSIMCGRMDVTGGETEFTWFIADVHDDEVLDSNWTTATWRGNAYSTTLVYDDATTMYIIYLDYVDPVFGGSSVEIIKWDLTTDSLWRAGIPAILNAGLYEVEAAGIVDDAGLIHIAGVAGTEDSIYYWNVDPSTMVFDQFVGIEEGRNNTITNNVSFFNVPSIIRNNSEISFSISEAGNVKIALYDVTGREIRSLINGNFNAGTHSVALDGNTMTQGIYFAKIMTNTYSDSKKIIIVK